MTRYKILSTKKLTPSLVEESKRKGIDILEKEFISILPLLSQEKYAEVKPWLEQPAVVIFTSAHSVEVVRQLVMQGQKTPSWQVCCIGGKTKESVQYFLPSASIMVTADNSTVLGQKIIEKGIKDVVFFCGNKRRDELPLLLKEKGVNIREIVVYETVEVPVLATDDIDGIIFFSPSSVQSFFSANQLKPDTVCFAIGHTTANAIAAFSDNKIIISETPSQDAVMARVFDQFSV